MNNAPSKIAASIVLMIVFLVDALLYLCALSENTSNDLWGFIALASVYVVSLIIAAGIVSIINK